MEGQYDNKISNNIKICIIHKLSLINLTLLSNIITLAFILLTCVLILAYKSPNFSDN